MPWPPTKPRGSKRRPVCRCALRAATLALGPSRIRFADSARDERLHAVRQDWRLRFDVDGRRVRVSSVESGVRKAELARLSEVTAELTLHRSFCDLWPT
jgi:hypothetical protein